MRQILLLLLFPVFLCAQVNPAYNLNFTELPAKWNEGLPLGDGLLGCLIWQNGDRLRLSLDRADLWDLRPMKGLDRPEFSYQWVAAQVAKKEYGVVQQYFDAPYETEAGPTKLPGGALEFNIGHWKPSADHAVELDISCGLATLQWQDGRRFETFVHAGRREGWFRCSGFPGSGECLKLIAPGYRDTDSGNAANSVSGNELARLGYPQSEPFQRQGVWLFHQSGWGGFSYEVAVCIRELPGGNWEGVWTVTSHFPQKTAATRAETLVRRSIGRGFDRSLAESKKWWSNFWSQSKISIPDPLIERQYYLDLYKFGCVARQNSPMISLQAIWTADNGRLPPWKGDLHHDLNTQLSYWPAYASNHLPEALSYIRHLESNDAAHRAYTKKYFGSRGLNIPGVTTLLGEPMGGWIQYSCSPTVAAWCAQHFYLQWRYSMDKKFLRDHAWPWLHDVAVFLSEITYLNQNGERLLPLSSSPEINDNDLSAWFPNTWTNYDLALTRFVFEKTAELATAMNLPEEAGKWHQMAFELPPFAREENGELKIATTMPFRTSHRHFSHLMAIHPLGLLDWSRPGDRATIQNSLVRLDSSGTDAWCGYSWAWLASLRARAGDGEGAREALRVFAEAFVSRNSFHLNGDQSGKGYSGFRYDPFTLEGNFAFASGVQEMLLQSQNGLVRVFPAVPGNWRNFSFGNLRAEGAFLVTAIYGAQTPRSVEVKAEKGGMLRIQLPPGTWSAAGKTPPSSDGLWQGSLRKGESIRFLNTATP